MNEETRHDVHNHAQKRNAPILYSQAKPSPTDLIPSSHHPQPQQERGGEGRGEARLEAEAEVDP
jgi:hypothetical protein